MNGSPLTLEHTYPSDLPAPRNQCQAIIQPRYVRDAGQPHRCPNQAKEGRRYCGRHRHWNLAREAWDKSKGARKHDNSH